MKFNLPEKKDLFGFINVYKPQGLTSHDVVFRLRKALKIKQIGHTGTLDPLAQGVLPVALGKATRLIEYLEDNKAYIAELEFGKVSDTYDSEGNILDFSDKKVSEEDIKTALTKFKGEIEQTPPAYSAVHYKGKRLYELARAGEVPEDIPKRKVTINKISLVGFNENNRTAKIEIDCSKGTYIRSIVHDLGQMLETGAIMTGLLRIKSGSFNIETAVKPDEIDGFNTAQKYLINPLEVLPYPKYKLEKVEFEKVKHGQGLTVKDFNDDEIVCLEYDNELTAVAMKSNNRLVVQKVF